MSYQEDDLTKLGRAWEARNREAFMTGYLRKAVEAEPILPTDPAVRSAVLAAFELTRRSTRWPTRGQTGLTGRTSRWAPSSG